MTKVKNYLLGYKNMYIYQDTDYFNFSLDSFLLANFVTINKKTRKILDIGCGNAPIPLILSEKTDANIIGVEIQKESYKLAMESVEINNKSDQINILNMDIKDYYNIIESDTFDVITCNPPYFKYNSTSNLNENKIKSIARHEILLNLNDIFKISKKLLKNNGKVALVHRPERLIEIVEIMKKNNIEPKRVRFVYPKENNDANIMLIEGTKNGKPGLKILPPLFSHDEDGTYKDEIKSFFE